MTTAELPPPMVDDDPVVRFSREALVGGDPVAKRFAEDFAKNYSQDIAEMDAVGVEEEMITQKHLAYWRYCVNPRCPILGHRSRTNWIVVGPARKGPFADIMADQFKKVYHAEPLEDQYGAYKINHYEENGLRPTGSFDPNHPDGVFETLIKLPGGILEFPLQQFLTLRMHHTPRLLSGRQDAQEWIATRRAADSNLNIYGEIPCDLGCADRSFLSNSEYESHQEGVHKEHKASVAAARETGKAIVGSMDKLADMITNVAATNTGNDALIGLIAQMIDNQNKILTQFAALQQAPTQRPGVRPAGKGE